MGINKHLICYGSVSNTDVITLPTSYTHANYVIVVGECVDFNINGRYRSRSVSQFEWWFNYTPDLDGFYLTIGYK